MNVLRFLHLGEAWYIHLYTMVIYLIRRPKYSNLRGKLFLQPILKHTLHDVVFQCTLQTDAILN